MSDQNPVGDKMRILAIVLAVAALIPAYGIWKWFFCRIEVPEGHFAVLIAKTGDNLPDGQILALEEDQKGIHLEVLPEGRHFKNPFFWDWRMEKLTRIPAGKVGIQVRLYGKVPDDALTRSGTILVPEGDPEHPETHLRGIVREVLMPGRAYRVNPFAYKVLLDDAVAIKPGFVGVVTNLHGKNAAAPNAYLVADGEKGVQRTPLQAGTHYLNPYEKRVDPVNVQSQRFELKGNSALVFPSEDGFDMRVLLTVEWSIDEKHASDVYVRIGVGDPNPASLLDEIRRKIIIPAVRGYGRVQGSKFPAIDYISGETRLQFQDELETKLRESVEPKGITIHSVLINDILPPQELAQPIREREVAKEELTANEAKRDQAVAEQALAREEELIKFEEAKVKATTERLKLEIDANNRREVALRQQEAKLIEATRALEEAKLRAAAITARGQAEADVVALEGEAEGRALGAAVNAFGDPGTYAKYVFALRAGPAIDSVLAGSGSPFHRLFEDLVAVRASRATKAEEGEKGARAGDGARAGELVDGASPDASPGGSERRGSEPGTPAATPGGTGGQ